MLWNIWQLFIHFILLPAETMEWNSEDAIGNFVYAELQSKEEKICSLENELVLANSIIHQQKEKIRRLEHVRELLMAAGMFSLQYNVTTAAESKTIICSQWMSQKINTF